MHYRLLLFSVFFVNTAIAQMYATTYTAGNISGPSGYTTATPTSCPGTLVINNIPNGRVIDSVVMSYTFFTTLAGFQSVVNQRSYVACPTFSSTETQLTQPNNPGPGTQVNYNRRVTIADGQTVNGPLTFIMYAGSADPAAFANCGNAQNVIMNNTWVVHVYTSNPSNSCSVPTALQTSQVGFDSAHLSWTQSTGSIAQWQIAHGLNGNPFSSHQLNLSSTPQITLRNLQQAATHVAFVRAICGAGDTSNWSAPVTFTTDTMPCLAPDSTWWFKRGNTTATVYWTPTHPQSTVHFEHGPAGFSRGTGTLVSNLQVDSIRIFNLQAITYDYYYQVSCNLSSTSWQGPFTLNMSTASIASPITAQVRLYPQPASDFVYIEIDKSAYYRLYDPMGMLVANGFIEEGSASIDVRSATNGLYLLELAHQGEHQMHKVLVNR